MKKSTETGGAVQDGDGAKTRSKEERVKLRKIRARLADIRAEIKVVKKELEGLRTVLTGDTADPAARSAAKDRHAVIHNRPDELRLEANALRAEKATLTGGDA